MCTHLAAVVDEGVHGLADGSVGGLTALHLRFEVVLKVRPHHVIVFPPFVHRDLGLGLNDSVDPPNCGHKNTHMNTNTHQQKSCQYKPDFVLLENTCTHVHLCEFSTAFVDINTQTRVTDVRGMIRTRECLCKRWKQTRIHTGAQ